MWSVVKPAPQPAPRITPVQSNFWSATHYSTLYKDATPPGANRWDCQPSVKHPRPVILVHGTWVDQYQSFAALAPRLAKQGYCVFSLNLGKTQGANYALARLYGTNDIMASARELAEFVREVQSKTGAKKVDMVGWSQGGVIIRRYLKYEGGASRHDPSHNRVQRVVTLGSPHRGTSLSGLATFARWAGMLDWVPEYIGPAGPQLVSDSPFIRDLNEGGETFPGIEYTAIYSPYDEVVNPPEIARLQAQPGAIVHNVDVNEGCTLDFSTHEALPYAKRSLAFTLRALDPETPIEIPCELQLGSMH